MSDKKIGVLIADDNGDLCLTIEQNILNTFAKYGISQNNITINKAFTEHAYEHGSTFVKGGFIPDICIFDLVFNGHTGIDLYKFIVDFNASLRPQLCIYTGVEKSYAARQKAEALASESKGDAIVIPKPNIVRVISWLESVLENKFLLEKQIIENDPFDML